MNNNKWSVGNLNQRCIRFMYFWHQSLLY